MWSHIILSVLSSSVYCWMYPGPRMSRTDYDGNWTQLGPPICSWLDTTVDTIKLLEPIALEWSESWSISEISFSLLLELFSQVFGKWEITLPEIHKHRAMNFIFSNAQDMHTSHLQAQCSGVHLSLSLLFGSTPCFSIRYLIMVSWPFLVGGGKESCG